MHRPGSQPRRVVYRALRDDEDASWGLQARDPHAECSVSFAVEEGSKAARKNQFIHTTTDPKVALYYAEAFTMGPRKHQLVKIDLTGFQDDGGQVLDVSTSTGCMRWEITSDKGKFFAMKHKVVLLSGDVEADRVLGTLDTQHMRPTRDKCSFDDFVHNLPQRIRSQLERFAGAAEVEDRYAATAAAETPWLAQPSAVSTPFEESMCALMMDLAVPRASRRVEGSQVGENELPTTLLAAGRAPIGRAAAEQERNPFGAFEL
ncbi:rhsC3 [Symbiodinium sp. CCMP2592]|nr:rhsC3 [Symbiodinium sp. CCMP2592]